jgi:hypothetical protein
MPIGQGHNGSADEKCNNNLAGIHKAASLSQFVPKKQ